MSEDPNPPPASPPSGRDSDTAARLRVGDDEGLRQLLEDHGGVVRMRLRQTFGRMLDDSELNEVLSMTSIRVWRAARRFDPQRGTLRAWLSVIARNCGLRLLEQRRAEPRVERVPDMDNLAGVASETSQLSEKERRELLDDVMTCVRRLPAMQRAILLADFAAGSPAEAEQLAARLRTTVNSIYVSRHRGRQTLRKALRSLGHRMDDDHDKEMETA